MTHSPLSNLEHERACRVCGCTDLRACMTAEGNCFWIEDDLCSACQINAGVCTITITATELGANLKIKDALPVAVPDRVLILESIVKEASVAAGEDPADAVMQLLVAAAHLAKQHSGGRSWDVVNEALQRNTASATGAASGWYDGMVADTPDLQRKLDYVSIVADACSRELAKCFLPGVRVTIIVRGPNGKDCYAPPTSPTSPMSFPPIERFSAKGAS